MRIDRREERNVIPRWRPLAGIEDRHLQSIGLFSEHTHVNKFDDFRDEIKYWVDNPDIASASDILDAYILTRDRRLISILFKLLKKSEIKIPIRMQDTLETIFRKSPGALERRRSLAFAERDQNYVRKSISILKRRIAEYPRDALSYLELARLYTVLGQFFEAEHNLHIARAIAPDNRIILRASLQFFDTVSNLDDGLKIIRKSSLLQHDPWIQSAEIATATALGKDSKIASRKLLRYVDKNLISYDTSELAMAIATLDRMHGVRERKFFQLVSAALPNSTENGFSQAVWLSENSSRDFINRFPEIVPGDDAFEAKLQLALEQQDMELAKGFSELWLEDQPFNVDAILHFLSLSSVHFTPNDYEVELASRYAMYFSENWQVLNACIIALTEGGRFDLAERILPRFEKLVPDDVNRAFVDAAKGLIAFARGDFATARTNYEVALRTSIRHKRRDLMINATIFWLRCEMANHLISNEFLEKMMSLIEDSIRKSDHSHRSYLENIWKSTKQKIEKYLQNETTEENYLHTVASKFLEEGDLFSDGPILIA